MIGLKRFAPPIAFALGVIAVLIAAAVTIAVVMQPPPEDLNIIVSYMIVTSLGSLGAGYILYRVGWWRWPGRIFYTLALGVVIQAAVVFFNVWLTARSMLINQHDLDLTSMLLLFGIGISIAFGGFAASSLTDRMTRLRQAARAVAAGDFSTRVDVKGRDELAELASTFNAMAAQLQASAERQKELDNLRRDLIAWASHDLRTPLTSIRVVIEALADDILDDAGARQAYLTTVQADIRSLSQMIDDLFELAQIDAGGLTLDVMTASLRDIISVVASRRPPLDDSHPVSLGGNVDADVVPLQSDPQKTDRVLINLTSTPTRHTPPDGNVGVQSRRADHCVHIQVIDTGEGIPPADLPHVFERFYRGDASRSRATGGAGLGLAIVRGIVEAHHGQISVRSQVGHGTTFEIVLPG